MRKSVFFALFLSCPALFADQVTITIVGRALSVTTETRTPLFGPSTARMILVQRLLNPDGVTTTDYTSYCPQTSYGDILADCSVDQFLGLSCVRLYGTYSSSSTDGTVIHGDIVRCQSPHAGRCQTVLGDLQADLTINVLSATQTPGGCSY